MSVHFNKELFSDYTIVQIQIIIIIQIVIIIQVHNPNFEIIQVFDKLLSNQVTIWHISRQLSCRDMCKFGTWLDYQNYINSHDNFHNIFMSS